MCITLNAFHLPSGSESPSPADNHDFTGTRSGAVLTTLETALSALMDSLMFIKSTKGIHPTKYKCLQWRHLYLH